MYYLASLKSGVPLVGTKCVGEAFLSVHNTSHFVHLILVCVHVLVHGLFCVGEGFLSMHNDSHCMHLILVCVLVHGLSCDSEGYLPAHAHNSFCIDEIRPVRLLH